LTSKYSLTNHSILLLGTFLLLVSLSSCGIEPEPGPLIPTLPVSTATVNTTPTPFPTPVPPSLLTICMGQEPASLFLYDDVSASASAIREALYDGPYDINGFEMTPVILERVPSIDAGDVLLEPVSVKAGDILVDADGAVTQLTEGVLYFPAGCSAPECALSYQGEEEAQSDQLVVRFTLRPDVLWSDGSPLTAADSVYSYEIARELFPAAGPELLRYTDGYQALDAHTIEWRGIPGYVDPTYATNFFSPMPQHVLAGISTADLLTSEAASRSPLGWGAYRLEQWVAGDHITFKKNVNYFRAGEGLPHFDTLVFRFINNADEALQALLSGECDFVDETVPMESKSAELRDLEAREQIRVDYESGTSWQHLDFGILPADIERASKFRVKELRQAIAMCIDRESLIAQLALDQSLLMETYTPPNHPLFNPQAKLPAFDPEEAKRILEELGWVNQDNDSQTPRVARGVTGIPDGTPFEVAFLASDGAQRELTTEFISTALAECGIEVNIQFGSSQDIFAPGPEGPIFGRQFELAQFGWVTALEPPCFLYTSMEIPGPYPEYPNGWGGANATGYSSLEFDQACSTAQRSLPDYAEYRSAHESAQSIFADEVPVIPLYTQVKQAAMRPDMCGVQLDPSARSALWNLEEFAYGDTCSE